MTHSEKRIYLIQRLLSERREYSDIEIPQDETEQRSLLRALFNVRDPRPIDDEFLKIQDEYLKEASLEKGITDIKDLTPVQEGIYIWQGDITSLKCDAIVNAANYRMLGCFIPNHKCIDNAIHTYAGVQLRLECNEIMKKQGYYEETGKAKITKAYNLPCSYVLHTVGPIVEGHVTREDEKLLSSCYLSCLKLAEENNLKNIAFCCISTGEFHFPNYRAAEIAINTVNSYRKTTGSKIEVIFNVFKDIDFNIYRELLG